MYSGNCFIIELDVLMVNHWMNDNWRVKFEDVCYSDFVGNWNQSKLKSKSIWTHIIWLRYELRITYTNSAFTWWIINILKVFFLFFFAWSVTDLCFVVLYCVVLCIMLLCGFLFFCYHVYLFKSQLIHWWLYELCSVAMKRNSLSTYIQPDVCNFNKTKKDWMDHEW